MYEIFSDDELIEAYSSMLDYSGNVSTEMLNEIEARGGLDSFKKKIEKKNILTQEINRISKEVYSLTSPETNVDFVKKLISSNILTSDQLSELVEHKFLYYQSINKDRAVSSKTIVGSIVGIFIGAILGSILLFLATRQLHGVYYFLIVPVYIVNYFIIKIITKQSRANPVVFISSFLATIGASLLWLYTIDIL